MDPHFDTYGAVSDPTFRRFLLARTVSMAGAVLSLVALPVLVYQLTGSASLTALMTVVESLPYLLVGLPAGALVDRWNRRRVMVLTGVASGLLMLSVPLVDIVGEVVFPHLLVVGAAVATLFVFMDSASFGIVPQMVGRERVASATASLVTVSTVLGLIGPVIAGVLVTTTSPALVLGLDGIAYLVSAAVTARLRWPGSEKRRGKQPGGSLRADMAEGLRYIWQMPIIRWLTVLGVGASLTGGAATGLMVVVGVEQLGLADDDPQLGWLYAAGALGALVASLSLSRVQRRLGVGLITTCGYAVALVGMISLSFTTGVPASLVAIAVLNLGLSGVIINGIVTRQVITPDRLQSRVNTTARLIAWGGNPLGAGLAGVLADAAGTEWALRIAATGLLVSMIAAILVGMPRYPRLATFSEASASAS